MEPQVEKFELGKFAPFVTTISMLFSELEAMYHIERNGNAKLF
jgi:hypothetical protein